jgi:hypothetical protein
MSGRNNWRFAGIGPRERKPHKVPSPAEAPSIDAAPEAKRRRKLNRPMKEVDRLKDAVDRRELNPRQGAHFPHRGPTARNFLMTQDGDAALPWRPLSPSWLLSADVRVFERVYEPLQQFGSRLVALFFALAEDWNGHLQRGLL